MSTNFVSFELHLSQQQRLQDEDNGIIIITLPSVYTTESTAQRIPKLPSPSIL
jgi:hypothetical protein